MLSKKNRVNTKGVEEIFKKGRFLNSPNLTFKYILETRGGKNFFAPKNEASLSLQKLLPPRVSFICPKSVAKLAVKRNLLRRRGYSALEKHLSLFPLGITGVFIFKKEISSVILVEDEIKTILHKIPLEAF